MVDFYVRRCEKNGVNFNTIPVKFQEQVRERIEADGYIILEDGSVVKAVL